MTWNDQRMRRRPRRWRLTLAPTSVKALAGLGLAISLAVPGIADAPAAAAAPAARAAAPAATQVRAEPAAAVPASALVRAFVLARKLPRDAVAGVRKGSVRVASDPATGTWWAMASFTPAAGAGARVKTGFQDGAGTAVFTRTAGHAWRLTHVTGAPFVCSSALPAMLRSAWHLSQPASCRTSPATQRAAALHARVALPARALAAAATTSADIGQDIANIALGQVGVSDVPAEYYFGNVDCDPYSTMDGPTTPNANGCGVSQNFNVVNENEEWCSDFAKWTWQQAGVTADINTLNAGADSFYAWGLQQGESMPVDSGSPAAGDAVVFYPPGPITASTYADHVGIITAVNPDGTVNIANGDFLGATNISVQYDTEVTLSTWASEVWNAGEQWVFVAPPAAAQQAAPTAAIVAAHNAVAGTSVPFAATAAEPGGSISGYQWTFGDGVTATGPAVSHVFGDAGLYTVAMTATSSLGTATTRTWNVDVVSPSAAVAATQSNQVWYTTTPLLQDLYAGSSSAGLTEEAWDGASWLDQSIPGQPSSSATAALNYPGAGDTLEPQVFFRAADGTLAQTSGGDGAWTASELVGQPAATSAIVATTVNDATSPRGAAPEVFYFNGSGQLSETSGTGGSWSTQTLPGPATSQPSSLALTDATLGGTPSQLLFYADGGGLTVTSSDASGWQTQQIRSPFGVAAGTPLSALTSGPDGLESSVFFVDGRGRLAEAAAMTGTGAWVVTELPGPAASTDGLASANYQQASGATSAEVFYVAASGRPVEVAQTGLTWQSSTLPGSATGILGTAAYPAAGGPQQLFLADGSAVTQDAATSSASGWAASSLPTTPASYADRILLYAATPADYANAQAAATAAGLPLTQVTDNFDVAWAATLSGNYLVIAIGTAAVDALYVNNCGWPNPSGDDIGTTPFYYYVPPFYGLPGADAFVNATAASSSQAVAAATDATYYALNGQLPPGVTSIPTLTGPDFLCEGSPS
jgi:PKD domain/CHAP domain